MPDYRNKKDIGFIATYTGEADTFPLSVQYTGTVSAAAAGSKVLVADLGEGDVPTTSFVEYGNSVLGTEEIREGFYIFDKINKEIRKVTAVVPESQSIVLDSAFTNDPDGMDLYVVKPQALDAVFIKNVGDTDATVMVRNQYGSVTYTTKTLAADEGLSIGNSTETVIMIDPAESTVDLSNMAFTTAGSGGGGDGQGWFTSP